MKTCLIGAGAVGGLMAARLLRSGQEVSIVARGATLDALRRDGLSVTDKSGTWKVQPHATGNPRDLGPQDLVILTVKAHALPRIADEIAPLIGPDTVVVTAVNGIPWWYFHGATDHAGHALESVDPGGRVAQVIGAERALGCVIHLGAFMRAPGQVVHAYGARLVLGSPLVREPDARMCAAVDALGEAGFKVEFAQDIRLAVWKKLLSNLAINPVSLITQAACDAIAADPDLNAVMGAMMMEAVEVARRCGTPLDVDIAEQLRGFAAIGAFKTSMLQDYLAGKPVELDPILGSVVEMAALTDAPAPTLTAVYALARARARLAGVYEDQPYPPTRPDGAA